MRTFLRRLRLNPGSTALITFVSFTAAACLGAGYLLMDAVLWRTLPGVPDARSLVVVTFPDRTGLMESVPLAFFEDLKATAGGGSWCPVTFGSMSKVTHLNKTSLRAAFGWMPSCGPVLGIQPVLGRFWVEGQPNGHRAIVISERFWESEFGRSPGVLGSSILVDDLPAEIVGVAPMAFMGLSVEIAPEIFTALNFRTGQLLVDGRSVGFRYLLSRFNGGAPAGLDRALRDRLSHLLEAQPVPMPASQRASLTAAGVHVDTTGRGFSYLRSSYSEPVRALVFVGGVLLLMALINVAGLSYAQTRRREREFIVREVLGAGRWQQVQLLAAELLWPVGVGVAIALPCSLAMARVLAQYLWTSPTPNSLILGFRPSTLAVFLAIGGLLAATALASAMWARSTVARSGSMALKSFRPSRVGVLLSAAQCAVSVAALFVAGILAHGVWNLARLDLGFEKENLVFARLMQARRGPPAPDQQAHYQRLVDEIRATPGISEVSLAAAFPRQVRTNVRADFAQKPVTVSNDIVSDGFFDVAGITLRAGRLFNAADVPQATEVAILTEGLAATLFPDGAALGRQVQFGQPERVLSIVGIVSDIRLAGPRLPAVPTVFTARRQQPNVNPIVLARTSIASSLMLSPLSEIVSRAGRDYTVGMVTIEDDLRRSLAPERTLQLLSWVLGALVCVLVAIGLFAQQVTWATAQRYSTVLRMVLGESQDGVVIRMVKRALGIVAAGTAAGVPLAVGAGAMLNRVLPGFNPANSWLLVVAAATVVLGGTVVSYLPTRFLSNLSTSEVLRLER